MSDDLNNEDHGTTKPHDQPKPTGRRHFLLMALSALTGAMLPLIASDTWILLKTEIGEVWRSWFAASQRFYNRSRLPEFIADRMGSELQFMESEWPNTEPEPDRKNYAVL